MSTAPTTEAAVAETPPELPGMPPTPEPSPTPDAPAKPKRARKPRAPRTGDSAPKPSPGPGRPSKDVQLQRQIAQLIALAFGMGSAFTSDERGQGYPGTLSRDLEIVAEQAEPLAAALVKVGKTNPAVQRALEAAVSTGAYGELLSIVLGGIALPIMANHGMLPAAIGGVFGQPAPAVEVPADGPPSP